MLPRTEPCCLYNAVIVRCNQTVSDCRILSKPSVTRSQPRFLTLYVHGLHVFVLLKLMFSVQRNRNPPQIWTRCLSSVFYHTTSSFLAKVPGFFIDLRSVSLAYSPSFWAWCARGPLPRRKCYWAIVHGRVDIVPHCLLTFCHQSYHQTRQNRRHFLICRLLNV